MKGGYQTGNQLTSPSLEMRRKNIRPAPAVDITTKMVAFAGVANLIDWNLAFVRQCPKLGLESFQVNRVRKSLIPLLISYFQDRPMSVKWRGVKSSPIRINGGGPQGATLGLLAYLSQTNNSADIVGEEDCFFLKFVDDLTILELDNLLNLGLCSVKIKQQMPHDMLQNNQFIPPTNLKSQSDLDQIYSLTDN